MQTMAVQWNPDPGWCVLFLPNHFESSVPEAVPRLLFFILFFLVEGKHENKRICNRDEPSPRGGQGTAP